MKAILALRPRSEIGEHPAIESQCFLDVPDLQGQMVMPTSRCLFVHLGRLQFCLRDVRKPDAQSVLGRPVEATNAIALRVAVWDGSGKQGEKSPAKRFLLA
jgi:hypothetical protein